MPIRRVFWLIPVVLTAHHLEKMLMGFRVAGAAVPPAIWASALAVITVAVVGVTALAARSRPGGPGAYLLLTVQALAALNAASLLVLAIGEATYQPGLMTGALLVVPFTAYLVRRMLTEGYAGRRGLLIVLLASAGLFIGLMWGLPAFGEWLSRCTSCA
jgi:hypothetical protein